MTATIILFPVPESGSSRVSGGVPDAAAPMTASTTLGNAGMASVTPLPHPGPLPGRGERGGGATLPAQGASYAGPCRRKRGMRSAVGGTVASGVQARAGAAPAAQSERLGRALEGLRAALAQQAGTVAAWRASLAEMEGAVGTLRTGLVRHAGAMQVLDTQVSGLGRDARALAQSVSR